MKSTNNDRLRYLTISQTDEDWGIVVTTIGYQSIPSKGEYPPVSRHPDTYDFKPQTGRILSEYQLVYITKGGGFFASQSCKKQPVEAGTMILLFPGEWHSYSPDPTTGWDEQWVGFRGSHIKERVEKGFFSKKEPLMKIGVSAGILNLYEDIFNYAKQESSGYQQLISGIVFHMLGSVYYKKKKSQFSNAGIVDKINEARILMKNTEAAPLSQEEIAEKLGLGYSWFRRMFKEYTGVSPAQYQLQQRLQRAKELLTTTHLNISEIAYSLHFENACQFSTFFKKKEGMTPSAFRERAR